ncbi:hypothetical protein M0805_007968 [Coniferiporia weirii]|nr:hypothetical protein M0805_007968 [Coniferiporia weirii]
MSSEEMSSAVYDLSIVQVYEYLLTLDDEMRLVWPSRMSLVKLIIMLNRYVPFVTTSGNLYFFVLYSGNTEQLCKPGIFALGLLSYAGVIFAEVIFAIRVYTIWQQSRMIMILLAGLLIPMILANFAITVIYLDSSVVVDTKILHAGCLISFPDRIEWIAALSLFFTEAAILSLTLWKGASYCKQMGINVEDGTFSTLMTILLQDGLLYCSCILFATLANVLFIKLASDSVSFFLLATQTSLHSILCTRLLLRLRRANAHLSSDQAAAALSLVAPTFSPRETLAMTDMSSVGYSSGSDEFAGAQVAMDGEL